MDEGTWRHPVMGNRHAWVTQTVSPAGWFTTTARQSLPKVRPEAEAAIQEALDKIGAHRRRRITGGHEERSPS